MLAPNLGPISGKNVDDLLIPRMPFNGIEARRTLEVLRLGHSPSLEDDNKYWGGL